jgi:hypothetical protein
MFLFPGIAVFITLAMLFSGCTLPTDMSIANGDDKPLVKLGNPVVRATAYDGFNVVSWEPVPDAATYKVWRTDTQSSSQVFIGSYTSGNTLSVVDNAATSTVEKLAHGRAYKYIVIAAPDARHLTNTGGTLPDNITAQEDLYSGKGEVTVTARIPDPASSYKVPQATGINYRFDSDGKLYVSWTQPANAKATIGYFPGGLPTGAVYTSDAFDNALASSTTVLTTGYLFSDTGAGYLYPKNAVTVAFPVIGGQATIAIQTEYWNGTMYARDNPATKNITLDQYDLDLHWDATAPALSATHIYKDETTGTVQLSWPRIKGDEDVYSSETYLTNASDKVTYNVYKRELAPNQDGVNYGRVYGDWSKVEFDIVDLSDGFTTETIYAVEKTAASGAGADGEIKSSYGNWQYVVFASASKGSKTSHSYPLTAYLQRTLPTEAEISAAVAYGNSATSTDPYTNRISVSNLTAGVSYKLYRGILTPILRNYYGDWAVPSANNYQFTAYDTTPIETWDGAPIFGDTTAAIYDSNIVPRTVYIYKLVSSIGDTLLGDGSVAQIVPEYTADAASVYSSLHLAVSALASSATRDSYSVYQGWITARLTNDGYSKGMTAELFYRRGNDTIPGATDIAWQRFNPPAEFGNATNSGNFGSVDVQIPNFIYDEHYQFKAVAYLDGKPVPNLNQDAYSGAYITEGRTSSIVSQSHITYLTSPSLTLSNDTAQTITGIRGDFLAGLPIDVRIVRSGSSSQTYVQPTSFVLARMPTFDATHEDYQVAISLTNRPTENGNTSTTPASRYSYTVQYKYPWETWDDTPSGSGWSSRQIGSSISW